MQQTIFPWLKETTHAVFSEDRTYRYALYRSLDGEAWDMESVFSGVHERRRLTICFFMLNPSKADEKTNDPTIEKLIRFGRAWGFDRVAVGNLFAYRETDSKRLRPIANNRDLIGPDNDRHLIDLARAADKIVCAWGKEGDILNRGPIVASLLSTKPLWCFKKNLDGSPAHPLYQRDAAELVEFQV